MKALHIIALSMNAAIYFFALSPAVAHSQTQCFPNNPSVPMAGTTCYDNTAPRAPAPPQDEGYRLRRSTEDECAGPHLDLLGTCRRLREAKAARGLELKDVAAMIVSGNCDGAIRRALSDSNFDLAIKAKTLCASTTSAAASH